jgi:hypothetical protein
MLHALALVVAIMSGVGVAAAATRGTTSSAVVTASDFGPNWPLRAHPRRSPAPCQTDLPPRTIDPSCDALPALPPPEPCDRSAGAPNARTYICRATCPFVYKSPGLTLHAPLPKALLRVTVDQPDAAVRGAAVASCDLEGLGPAITTPFVASSGDSVDIPLPGGERCDVIASALWTQPYDARASHTVTFTIVPA